MSASTTHPTKLKLRSVNANEFPADDCPSYDVSCDLAKLSMVADGSAASVTTPPAAPGTASASSGSSTTSPSAAQLKPRIALSPTDNITVNFVFSPSSSDSSDDHATYVTDDGPSHHSRQTGLSSSPDQPESFFSVSTGVTGGSSETPEMPVIKLQHRSISRRLTAVTLHPEEPATSSTAATLSPYHRVPTPSRFTLTQFRWIKTIGTGTFGRVVLCEDTQAATDEVDEGKKRQRFYAMKILRIIDIFRLKQVEHIMDEKKILQDLDHPFIVKLLWSHHDAINLYMLLEYAAGGELFTYLRSVGRFPVPTAMFYAAEIILALEYLHGKTIVYRDLKPENLIFAQSGHIKITDFGFAKELVDRTWTLCGTPEYLAPEIIQSRGYNKAVDYWALGILLYEMLAGHPPFFSENPIEIYQKILDAKIRWPKNFDLVAKDLIKKLLVADRTKRLGNMKNGVQDIKMHRWFRSINWTSCLNCEIEPPYIPQIRHEGDASNFDDYAEDWRDENPESAMANAEQLDVFKDF